MADLNVTVGSRIRRRWSFVLSLVLIRLAVRIAGLMRAEWRIGDGEWKPLGPIHFRFKVYLNDTEVV